MSIVSGLDSPLLGPAVVSNNSKVVEADKNIIFYEAIPFEMLRTYETNPQI